MERIVKYPLKTEQQLDIVNRFTFHPTQKDQGERYERLRLKGREFAELLLGECPQSREQSLAITKLEEAIFWANASIARHENLGEE